MRGPQNFGVYVFNYITYVHLSLPVCQNGRCPVVLLPPESVNLAFPQGGFLITFGLSLQNFGSIGNLFNE